MEWTKKFLGFVSILCIIFLIVLFLPSFTNPPNYHTYSLDFEKSKVFRPGAPVWLGGAGSLENRVYINDSTLYTLNKWHTTDEWFFYSFNLQSNVINYTYLKFPRDNISSNINYRFQGLSYHEGLFYTIGSDFYNNLSLIRFSPNLDCLEVSSLQIPILYETNSSTSWHRVGGLGVSNEIFWVFLGGYAPGWLSTYTTIYGLSLDTFEVISQFEIVRPFRFHGCMDEKGIFWVYYRNDVIDGTTFAGKTFIGYNLVTQQIQAVITGDLHEFVMDRNPYETSLGRAFTDFDYQNIAISQNKVIFDDSPLIEEQSEHFFNGFYVIPFD